MTLKRTLRAVGNCKQKSFFKRVALAGIFWKQLSRKNNGENLSISRCLIAFDYNSHGGESYFGAGNGGSNPAGKKKTHKKASSMASNFQFLYFSGSTEYGEQPAEAPSRDSFSEFSKNKVSIRALQTHSR